MRTIDADRLLTDRAKGTYYHLPNGDTAIPIIDIEHAPTVDAVPRQKHEEDMENAFAHGYTDAESNFRKMIADGELVEVVRCRNCKYYKKTEASDRMMCCRKDVDGWPVCYDFNPNDFCSYGERRANE